MSRPRFLFRCFALAGVWLAVGSAVFAADPVPASTPAPAGDIIYPRRAGDQPTPSGSGAGTSASTGLLITALALAAAGGWLFWRNRRAPGGTLPERHLALIETKSLGNRQYLVVAAYQDKRFLLGICPGRIDLLTPLDGSTPPPRAS